MNTQTVIEQNNAQQTAIYLERATVYGTKVGEKTRNSSRQPTVDKVPDGMVNLTMITRKNMKSSSFQAAFLATTAVYATIDKLMKTGLKREECVCVVQTMSHRKRNGSDIGTSSYLCGGTFAHPTIVAMYQRYINEDPHWDKYRFFKSVDDDIVSSTPTDTPTHPDIITAPKSCQNTDFKPSTPATPTIPPPVPIKAPTKPNQDRNSLYQCAIEDLLSIYGGEGMAERLDDVIYTYTESMIGRGDSCTMETICAMRVLRDAFRISNIKQCIAV